MGKWEQGRGLSLPQSRRVALRLGVGYLPRLPVVVPTAAFNALTRLHGDRPSQKSGADCKDPFCGFCTSFQRVFLLPITRLKLPAPLSGGQHPAGLRVSCVICLTNAVRRPNPIQTACAKHSPAAGTGG